MIELLYKRISRLLYLEERWPNAENKTYEQCQAEIEILQTCKDALQELQQ